FSRDWSSDVCSSDLHTRFRVSDLERSIRWYCDNLGFQVTRRTDRSPAGNQLAFLELPGNDHAIELCYSPDYDLKVPEDLMHIAKIGRASCRERVLW